jgi:hypothetical protein
MTHRLTAVVNICNHEEGIHSLSINENWTQITAHSQKRYPSDPSISPLTLIRTTNIFEALHNLDKELTKQTNATKKKSHKSNSTTQGQGVKESISLRTNRHKNKEEVLLVFDIPVLVNGCVPVKCYENTFIRGYFHLCGVNDQHVFTIQRFIAN